jgi:3,5-epimerase/4-reductase
MKTMICGPRGFLGSAFLQAIPDAVASQVDISDPAQVAAELDRRRPDVLINCAGKTGRPNIDWCETHKLETARANITGPLVLLDQCLARGVYLIHIGSGCIYEGDNHGLGFGEQDPPNYRGSYYSRTKICADDGLADFPVLILRLRMPFDDSTNPRNLLNRLAGYRQVLDEQNSLTYLPDFVAAARRLIQQRATGIYHIVNPGATSPYEIMRRYQALIDPGHEFKRLEARGLADLVATGRSNCVLSTKKLEAAGLKLRPIDQAVDLALRSLAVELGKPSRNATSEYITRHAKSSCG